MELQGVPVLAQLAGDVAEVVEEGLPLLGHDRALHGLQAVQSLQEVTLGFFMAKERMIKLYVYSVTGKEWTLALNE